MNIPLKLLRLDRVEDVVRVGLEQPLSDEGLLKLVKALYERDEIEAAFQLAEHGLRHLDTTTPTDTTLTEIARQARAFGLYHLAFSNRTGGLAARPSCHAWPERTGVGGEPDRVSDRAKPGCLPTGGNAGRRGLVGATAEAAGFSAWQCPHRHRNQG